MFKPLTIFWALLFAVFLAISMDFWRWDNEIQYGFLGLPEWIYLFVAVQVALAVVLYYLGKKRNKKPMVRGNR